MRRTAACWQRGATASPLDSFLGWVAPLSSSGGGRSPSPFEGPFGLGLRAPAPGYRAGQTVLTVPVPLWGPVSALFALDKAKELAPAFHDALLSLDAGDRSGSGSGSVGERGLTAPIALATHLGLVLLDDADSHHPYAHFLIESTAEPHPLLLGGDALRSLFQASPVVAALEKRQHVYSAIHGRLFPPPEPPLPFPLFLWAVTRVLSRAISGPGRPLTLVPFFDLLNHSHDGRNCEYKVGAGPEGSDIVVRATRDVR